jgi:stage II sporulation SpoE-like protein/histidine kinase-like protein
MVVMEVVECLRFLSEPEALSGAERDHIQAAKALVSALVPHFADLASVVLLEQVADGRQMPAAPPREATALRRVATAGDRLDRLGEPLLFTAGTPWAEAMLTGDIVYVPEPGQAVLIVPLRTRGRVFGTLSLLRGSHRAGFDEFDLAAADDLGCAAALSIDNGRLYWREVRAVQDLQRSLLPAAPPTVAGARVCFRYRPAARADQAGGDWFDAVPLPRGRLGIVVGDVLGAGLGSVGVMGQLRTALRALAAQDPRPHQLLRQLDEVAAAVVGPDCLATCLYGVYDPIGRICSFANAGHVPPVLVSPHGVGAVLDLGAGMPIGVGGGEFETMECEIADGSRLVLCTDGLLGPDLDQGLAALVAKVAELPGALESACDAVLAALVPAAPSHDVALVMAGLDGIPAGFVAVWDLEPEPSMVPDARAQARAKLIEWGLAELADTVELLVSELVTNALLHGAGAIQLRLVKAAALLCEVGDDGQELPILTEADPSAESGRGLFLVSQLAGRWGTRRTGIGKIVWFETALG